MNKLQEKLRKIIREEVSKHINESKNLKDLNKLEDYVYDNKRTILNNIKRYGFKIKDLRKMKNYMDLTNILGVDSRMFKGADIQYYGEYIAGLLGNFPKKIKIN